MSQYLSSLITPRAVDAAADLHQAEPDTFASVAAAVRRFAASKVTPGGPLDADDLAAVAALTACDLIREHDHSPSMAAALAVTTAVRGALRDYRSGDAGTGATAGSLDQEDTPLIRLAAPAQYDPQAAYTTTTGDRYARCLAALPDLDGVTAHALLDNEHKGGKVPAAAVRRAHGLPPVTGRAGTAWTAQVTADAARILPALQDEYRDALTLDAQACEGWEPSRTYGQPRTPRRCDLDAQAADQAAKTRNQDDARRKQDRPHTSGPASLPRLAWDQRSADRLGVMDGSARRAVTQDDRRTALDVEAARQRHAALDVPAYRPETVRKPTAQAVQDGEADAILDESGTFDPMATGTDRTAQRLPGVTVHRCTTACPSTCDQDGAALAMSGPGCGTGNGSSAAVTRAPGSRKSKGGSTGPTVTLGGSRGPAVVQATMTGKPSAAGMGSTARCACDAPTPSADHLDALAVVNYAGSGTYADAPAVRVPAAHCPLHQVTGGTSASLPFPAPGSDEHAAWVRAARLAGTCE